MVKKKITELNPGLIIIDPKSKFYGLPEDCNTSAAIWLNHIQELIMNVDATILIPHHVSKAGTHFLDPSSSRGASAFIDGCRWAANIKVMDEDTGKKFYIDNHKSYIEMLVTKSNYTALPSEPLRFKHVEGSGLEQVDLSQKGLDGIVDLICNVLETNPHKMASQNEILRLKEGEFVRNYIKKHDKKVSRSDINNAIIYGLQTNIFYELDVQAGTKTKKIICVKKD